MGKNRIVTFVVHMLHLFVYRPHFIPLGGSSASKPPWFRITSLLFENLKTCGCATCNYVKLIGLMLFIIIRPMFHNICFCTLLCSYWTLWCRVEYSFLKWHNKCCDFFAAHCFANFKFKFQLHERWHNRFKSNLSAMPASVPKNTFTPIKWVSFRHCLQTHQI